MHVVFALVTLYMKKVIVCLSLLWLSSTSFAQSVKVVSWEELDQYLHEDTDKVRVVNFWATWCGPCVKELPHFQAAHERWGDTEVEIVLVSLDDVEILEKKVQPFVERKGLTATVLLLDEIDYNMFIPKVDERWTGAIPMTLILDNTTDERRFFEREIDKKELFQEIKSLIN